MFRKRDDHDEYDERYSRRPIRERREGPFLWLHVALIVVIGGGFVLGVFGAGGNRAGEQLLKSLATPVGIAWLLLTIQIYFCLLHKRWIPGMAAIAIWIILTAGGNQWVRNSLYQHLEHSFLESRFAEIQTVDALLILGGGTTATPQGDPQLAYGGDRVMMGARLFYAGKVNRIFVSGQQTTRTTEKDLEPGQEAKLLLTQIGIPENKITVLVGATTSDEMQSLKTWLEAQDENSYPKSIGIVTSAWHLPRALGLAQELGIDAVGIPADFVSAPYVPTPSLVVPSASNLSQTAGAIHEILGRMLGR